MKTRDKTIHFFNTIDRGSVNYQKEKKKEKISSVKLPQVFELHHESSAKLYALRFFFLPLLILLLLSAFQEIGFTLKGFLFLTFWFFNFKVETPKKRVNFGENPIFGHRCCPSKLRTPTELLEEIKEENSKQKNKKPDKVKKEQIEIIENSIEALCYAVENGTGGIEIDVQLTKDNEIVIFHDLMSITRLCENPFKEAEEEKLRQLKAYNLEQKKLKKARKLEKKKKKKELKEIKKQKKLEKKMQKVKNRNGKGIKPLRKIVEVAGNGIKTLPKLKIPKLPKLKINEQYTKRISKIASSLSLQQIVYLRKKFSHKTRIGQFTLEELKICKFKGTDVTVPTFAEFVEELNKFSDKKVKLMIEVKQYTKEKIIARKLSEMFEKYPFLYDHSFVASFNPNMLYYMRKVNPNVVTCMCSHRSIFTENIYDNDKIKTIQTYKKKNFVIKIMLKLLFMWMDYWYYLLSSNSILLYFLGIKMISINQDIQEKYIKKFHKKGFQIVCWTANNEKEVDRLKDLQVEGIITDEISKLTPQKRK